MTLVTTETGFRSAGIDPEDEGYFAATADGVVLSEEGRIMAASLDHVPSPHGDTETETAAETSTGWTEEMDTILGPIADVQIAELIRVEVVGADGEPLGEIDNFALMGENIVAVVGIGEFLGIGEHTVVLPLEDMSFDGNRLKLTGLSEEQLRNLPEFDETTVTILPQESALGDVLQ